jgi:hypothetical protein
MKLVFEEQEKAGVNTKGNYQFGSNACVGCKKARPLKEEGMWCDGCMNYNQRKPNPVPEGKWRNES